MGQHPRNVAAVVVFVAGWLVTGATEAQPQQPSNRLPTPQVWVVHPAGGKAGDSVEVTVSGQDLDAPQGLWFSHPGITAEPLGPGKEPEPAQTKGGRRGMQQALTSQRFKIVIPADAPVGLHDVRLVNALGVSNPRAFVVGDLAEVVEKEPNNDVAEAQRVALNTTINGAVSGGTDVDDFVFEGKKGQRVLVSGLTSSIDSRLLLALELYDASGKRLASDHEYQGTDALLDVALPTDGDYLVRAFAFTYTRGGVDSFYRLSLTTAPWIDAVWPPVVEPGKPAQVTVFGRNLPGGRPDPSALENGRVLDRLDATIEPPAAAGGLAFRGYLPPGAALVDGFEYRVRNEAGASNPFLLTFATAPVVHDRGNNETPETAQPLTPPCEVAGRIEAQRDRDWYAFEAKKGDVLSIEVFGARIGAPVDLYFVLRNPRTKAILGEFDETAQTTRRGQNMGEGLLRFYTVTDDPDRHRFVAPDDGRFELMVSSREAATHAGPRHYYRLRIAPEQPDFQLVVMPAAADAPDACVLRRGGLMEATVFVKRSDGHTGPISLSAEGLPEGVTCPPQVVGTNLNQGSLVLSAAPDAPAWTGAIAIRGTATIAGEPVVREARSVTISWPGFPQQQQVNIPYISRVDRALVLAVRDQAPFRIAAEPAEATLTQGETATVTVKLDRLWPDFKGPAQLSAVGLPTGLTYNNQTLKDELKAVFEIKPNVAPGVYSIVFRGQAQVPFSKDPAAKTKPDVPVILPSTPVTLTILPKEKK